MRLELPDVMARRSRGTGWLTAKSAMYQAMRSRYGDHADIEIGRVKRVGEGLHRDVYRAPVGAVAGGNQLMLDVAALVPRWDAPRETDDGARKEVGLLSWLADQDLPFRVPGWAEAVEEERRTILVREFLTGIPLDLFSDRRSDFTPWEVIGPMAAAIHAIPVGTSSPVVRDHETRRDHALACLAEVEEAGGDPVADDAVAWIRAHLPPEDPSTLNHGDLLGQNILLDFDGPPALIDWEYSLLGDPAYDLAIVTRGVKRPFKQRDGLDLLLDAYNEDAECEIFPEDVRLYEFYLFLNWYLESCRGEGRHSPDVSRDRLRALVRRIDR